MLKVMRYLPGSLSNNIHIRLLCHRRDQTIATTSLLKRWLPVCWLTITTRHLEAPLLGIRMTLLAPRSPGSSTNQKVTQPQNSLSMPICVYIADPLFEPFLEWSKELLGLELFVTNLSNFLPMMANKSGLYVMRTRTETGIMESISSRAARASPKFLDCFTLTSFVRLTLRSVRSCRFYSLRINLLLIRFR